jgi:putative intracellular protease/amidase
MDIRRPQMTPNQPKRLGIVLFDGFELLDVFGPVELFSRLPEDYPITFIAPTPGPVRSGQGVEVVATVGLDETAPVDVVLVPGGPGTRSLVEDVEFLGGLTALSSQASIITSVCTGSALLAAAGLLEGFAATSNKKAYTWVTTFGTDVDWVPRARWVHDRNRWTSSGVAAGMDMTAALIAHLSGSAAAEKAAAEIELEIHEDPDWDPFAGLYGLD